MLIPNNCFFLLCLFGLFVVTLAQGEGTCEADDGTCQASPTTTTTTTTSSKASTKSKQLKTRSMRFFSQTSYCTSASSTSKDLYQHGGSAQAYRPNAALSSTVCSKSMAEDLPYKVSSWPFSRRTSRKGTAPTMDVTLHLWSCRPKTNDGDDDPKVSACACSPLVDVSSGKEGFGATPAGGTVEVWQTQPDGQYPSLHSSTNECRATIPVNEAGDAEFTTVAPGSTGFMAGLGPNGWDTSPYGPPVLHILVQASHHDPLLLDIPVMAHPKSLEERQFSLTAFDWRGLSWSKRRQGKKAALPFKVVSWSADTDKNHVDVSFNVFLQLRATEEEDASTLPEFCPSWYFLPGSFFLEPISVCARYLLDFFHL